MTKGRLIHYHDIMKQRHVQFNFNWIKGHQDNLYSLQKLPENEYLNVIVDLLTQSFNHTRGDEGSPLSKSGHTSAPKLCMYVEMSKMHYCGSSSLHISNIGKNYLNDSNHVF